MPPDSVELTIKKPTARARLTNGHSLLSHVDGRSQWARRFRDLLAEHAADLGGYATLSEGQKQLIRRASAIEVECELMETRLALGENVSLLEYQRLSNTLRRLLTALGLNRTPFDITPRHGNLESVGGRE